MIVAETNGPRFAGVKPHLLQWGRDLIVAETSSKAKVMAGPIGFNGAAT